MRINTRFPVAVHILSLIALSDKPVTSEMMALSAGSHPVVIRQVMSSLKKAGLVETRNGLPGGKLSRPQEEITLREIYQAVKITSKSGSYERSALFDLHPAPNPSCPVGRNIRSALEIPFADAQEALESKLAEYTLKDVTAYITEKYTADNHTIQNGGNCYEGI